MHLRPSRRILIVDDEEQILDLLETIFRDSGWRVTRAGSGARGIEALERDRFDVVLTDLKMPGADGIEVLRTARKIQPDSEVILMTGFGTVESAIEAMRAGAFHYLTKPFQPEEVLHLVEKAYLQHHLQRENRFLKAEARGEHPVQAIVGTSPAVQRVADAVRRLADTDTPVLLTGERGTGRLFLARVIHYNSPRSSALFVPVHCAGIPEPTLERDLFGHDPGAYDRAVLPLGGKLEMANHGTVYLSEIGEAGRRVQERLLELLTERTITPVGSDRKVELDVRLVASASLAPEELEARGRLLPKLREILAPGTIPIAPLRERPEDVPLLLYHFLYRENRERKKPLSGYSQTALNALAAYPWPGNVRELLETVRQVVARKKQGAIVDAADLPVEILYGRRGRKGPPPSPPPAPDVRTEIENLERPMVLQALALAEWDKARAAELLHVDVSALEELMRRNEIEE